MFETVSHSTNHTTDTMLSSSSDTDWQPDVELWDNASDDLVPIPPVFETEIPAYRLPPNVRFITLRIPNADVSELLPLLANVTTGADMINTLASAGLLHRRAGTNTQGSMAEFDVGDKGGVEGKKKRKGAATAKNKRPNKRSKVAGVAASTAGMESKE
ncbi:hypothetical protein VTL71DRAFT_3708 [Oculimacula yallundae]|uniref:Uncharacterized protein n=1 Tax=Oculimacula yallundae TaxID=86028 RepID=A0ABR4C3Q9_9HELO